MAAISYILPLLGPWANENGPAWLEKLNEMLTGRIQLSWEAYNAFDIKIAGQLLTVWPAPENIDNIFVYLLYQVGPVMLALVCILLMVALYGYARRGAWRGGGLPYHGAGLRLYGDAGHPPDQRPRHAAGLRCGVCAAEAEMDV